jgi:hypothetical protein
MNATKAGTLICVAAALLTLGLWLVPLRDGGSRLKTVPEAAQPAASGPIERNRPRLLNLPHAPIAAPARPGSTPFAHASDMMLAPRARARALPREVLGPEGHGRTDAIDGCSYSRLTPQILGNTLGNADFAAIVTIDYDYRASTRLRRGDGSIESMELTPIELRSVQKVLLNRTGRDIGEFYLAGGCDASGLCRVHDCEHYVNSGTNLLIGQRYCGEAAVGKVVMIALAVYPLENDDLYEFDGSFQSLSGLLSRVQLDPTAKTTTTLCEGS